MLRGGSPPTHPAMWRRRIAGSVVLVALLGVGCSGDGGDEAGSTSTSSTTTTAATESVPTTDPDTEATPSTAPSAPTAFTAEARDAVNELKAAWDEGDQDRARAIAPGEVVDALFPIPPDGFEVYGCDTGEFETSTCSYRNRSTGAYITVTSTRTEPGWQVTSLFVDGG